MRKCIAFIDRSGAVDLSITQLASIETNDWLMWSSSSETGEDTGCMARLRKKISRIRVQVDLIGLAFHCFHDRLEEIIHVGTIGTIPFEIDSPCGGETLSGSTTSFTPLISIANPPLLTFIEILVVHGREIEECITVRAERNALLTLQFILVGIGRRPFNQPTKKRTLFFVSCVAFD